eukprot:3674527-Rhodomonas_salina.1
MSPSRTGLLTLDCDTLLQLFEVVLSPPDWGAAIQVPTPIALCARYTIPERIATHHASPGMTERIATCGVMVDTGRVSAAICLRASAVLARSISRTDSCITRPDKLYGSVLHISTVCSTSLGRIAHQYGVQYQRGPARADLAFKLRTLTLVLPGAEGLAIGLLGCVAMPHNLFLQSALVLDKRPARNKQSLECVRRPCTPSAHPPHTRVHPRTAPHTSHILAHPRASSHSNRRA